MHECSLTKGNRCFNVVRKGKPTKWKLVIKCADINSPYNENAETKLDHAIQDYSIQFFYNSILMGRVYYEIDGIKFAIVKNKKIPSYIKELVIDLMSRQCINEYTEERIDNNFSNARIFTKPDIEKIIKRRHDK